MDRRPINEQPAPSWIVSRLRELGWEEGRNLSIDYRFAESPDAMPQLSTMLIASKPDVLIALGPFPAHAFKAATQTIPIVFAAVADPVGVGLVPSLARPGANVTGVSHYVGPSMGAKPAQLLKEFVPRAERMAWLINPANPIFRTGVTADAVFNPERHTIVKLAEKHKIPTAYPNRSFVDVGGLISYGSNFLEVYQRVAVYVDKVLRGAKPADLPIEQPTTFEMVANLRTAKALGLTIPQSVLVRANQVIE